LTIRIFTFIIHIDNYLYIYRFFTIIQIGQKFFTGNKKFSENHALIFQGWYSLGDQVYLCPDKSLSLKIDGVSLYDYFFRRHSRFLFLRVLSRQQKLIRLLWVFSTGFAGCPHGYIPTKVLYHNTRTFVIYNLMTCR
jgi:hypothetical protein